MDAVMFTSKERKLELVHLPKPKICQPHEIVVKIFFAGIAKKDIYMVDGTLTCSSEPFIPGHEISGVVSSIGSEVDVFNVGDRVVVDPNSGCGLCNFCRAGVPHYCQIDSIHNTIGIFRNGGWAEYIVVLDRQVFKIPDTISTEQAVLTQPLATVWHGWNLLAPMPLGNEILIMGTGLVGNLWAAVLYCHGHRKVVVSDMNLARLEYLQKLELSYECLTPQILMEKHQTDPSYVFDVIIDCSGNKQVMEQEFSLLNPGGKWCVFGVKPRQTKISISPFDIYQKEIKIVGANAGTFDFPRTLVLLESLGDKYLDLDSLGIKSYPLSDFSRALHHVRKSSVTKAIFNNTIQCHCPDKKVLR